MADNTPWLQLFDFTKNDGGWVPSTNDVGTPIGHYSPGSGWTPTDVRRPTSGAAFRSLVIEKNFGRATLLTKVIATYDASSTTDFGNHSTDTGSDIGLDTIAVVYVPWITPTGTNLIMEWDGSSAASKVEIDLRISIDLPSDPSFPRYAGSGTLKSVMLTGVGINPFLDGYCVACAINHIAQDVEEVLDAIGL